MWKNLKEQENMYLLKDNVLYIEKIKEIKNTSSSIYIELETIDFNIDSCDEKYTNVFKKGFSISYDKTVMFDIMNAKFKKMESEMELLSKNILKLL